MSLISLISLGAFASALFPRDISSTFEVLFAPWGAYSAEDFFSSTPPGGFQLLKVPGSINKIDSETWLRTTLPAYSQDAPIDILEIPGQIFNYIDVWYRHPNGQIEHYYAGDNYPYVDRVVKHASSAFPVPPVISGSIEVLIRARNETAHPMNFAAWVWPIDRWQDYLLIKRAWYGVFIGAILALCIYNIFLAITLKDSSYVYYVGYVLCLMVCIILLSGMAEEYLWPQGKPAPFVLAWTGMGTFLAVGFVNQFLKVRKWRPSVYWFSTAVSGLALLCGLILVFSHRLPFIPGQYSVTVVHVLALTSAAYFIGMSLTSYFRGVTHARFLAVSMLALLSSMLVYFSYTYGFLRYNLFIGHSLEFGALAEGVLLSLALADRITILNREKQAAEQEAVEVQKSLSRQLISAQEKQRQIVSEALHDSIGHAVLVLKNNLVNSVNLLSEGNDAGSNGAIGVLQEQVDQCSEIMADVRRLSHDLHPHMLERLGLVAAVESTFERALGSSTIKWQLDVEALPDNLASGVEITIYRAIQEALSNALKYSGATEVICRISKSGETIFCRFSDNGVGIDAVSSGGDTLGLQDISGRVQLLGGRFEIESKPGQGMAICFELPIMTTQK